MTKISYTRQIVFWETAAAGLPQWFLAVLLVLATYSSAAGAVAWNETTNGDLSGNRLAPTSVPLAAGDNEVIGSVQGNPSDLDYLTINVPAGEVLSQIILKSFASTDTRGFIGLQSGSTFTEPTVGTNVAHLLGYTHFGPGAGNVGANILPEIAIGAGTQGSRRHWRLEITPSGFSSWAR